MPPPETREMQIQTEPPTQYAGGDIDPYDGNMLMKVSKMENFIRLSTNHSAKCGSQLVLIDRDMNYGAFVRQVYKCPACCEELVLENCDKVKSTAVAEGASHSRHQPDFNLRMLKGADLAGVNTQKLAEFLHGELGIKIAAEHNLRKQETKVRKSIGVTYEARKIENREEHNQAVRERGDYRGDVQWSSQDGVAHLTSCGDISIDGGYATRSYNNHHRGKQAAVIVNSKATKKPLALAMSQVGYGISFTNWSIISSHL